MARIVENLIKNLKIKNFRDLDSSIVGDFAEHYELNELMNVAIVDIEGEEGVLVLDKALCYEIYFININSYEISKLYWSLDENEASIKYKEMEDCCKKR